MECLVCGKEFKPHDKDSKYCSIECQHNGIRKRPTKAICKYCGLEFDVGRNRAGLFCSNKCSSKYYGDIRSKKALDKKQSLREEKERIKEQKRISREQQYIASHTKECVVCGKTFISNNTRTKYCSVKCSNRINNNAKDKRIYKNGKPDLSINLSKLYKRDNGICKCCGIVCDWGDIEVREDGTMIAGETYPSIDHIQPISKGGKHEWNNVQLLCRHCNTIKSNKDTGG